MTPDRISVVVCDDDDAQTALMHIWLRRTDDIVVLGTVTDRSSAVELCVEHPVDVLVLDYEMPGDPLTIRGVRALLPAGTVLVIWTGYDREDLPAEDILAAAGVLVKGINAEIAATAIRQAIRLIRRF